MKRYTTKEVKEIMTAAFPERPPFCFAILNWYRKSGYITESFPGSRDYTDADLERLAWLTELRMAGISISKLSKHPDFLKTALDQFKKQARIRLNQVKPTTKGAT